VSFNYRLGPLGFPQGKEADQRHVLNLGIKDQIAALEWVQHNIGVFGGDPNKVTAAGESAGSVMTSILFLDRRIDGLARAAIFESGHANTLPIFHAAIRETDWQDFVRNVPSCAYLATSGSTIHCLQGANSSEITQGLLASISEAPEQFPWTPALDGPSGIVPNYTSILFAKGLVSKLPFIAGTNLDEGTLFVAPPIPPPPSESFITQSLIANYSPPVVCSQTLESDVQELLQLYPDIPALGSPYNTGNNTFGLGVFYKQWASIVGDLYFHSLRRFWSRAYSAAGITTYGYLFTEPSFEKAAELGVLHSAELPFVFGNLTVSEIGILSPSSSNLSTIIIDYWVSFATSLDPNDGHGTARPLWQPYSAQRQALIQLNSNNLTMISDDYREEQINFINSDPIVWLH
jgi:carboxylesterase type B